MNRIPHTFRWIPVLAAAMGLAGCGGGPTTPPPPPSPPPVLTTISVTPADAELQAVGATTTFAAVAYDQTGKAMSGVTFAWLSSDETVATIDQDGVATAQRRGQATISATALTEQGTADLRVVIPSNIKITSVSPGLLAEGQVATLDGSGFDPQPGRTLVLVDGQEAAISAIDAVQVTFQVPAFDCLPPRDAAIRVAVADDTSDVFLHPIEAPTQPVQMAVGEYRRLSFPADFCLQFAETDDTEAYAFGVQNTSTAPGLVSAVVTTSTAGGASAAIAPDIRPGSRGAVQAAGRRPARFDLRRELLRRHRVAERRIRALEDSLFGSRADASQLFRRTPGLPAVNRASGSALDEPPVPGSAQVGDTLVLRVPTFAGCAFVAVDAVVRHVGVNGIFLEDVENPEGGFTSTDFASLSQDFDNFIFAADVDHLGQPTDIDSNSRIAVLITKQVNIASPGTDGGGIILGYVWRADMFPRSSCAASNEGEIFYGRAPDPDELLGRVFPTATALALAPVVIAHELAHVIQVGRRVHVVGAEYMDSWMMEGQATLAEEVVGHVATGRQPGQNYNFRVAFNSAGDEPVSGKQPDAPEACSWLQSTPDPCEGRPLWYGVTWSFLRWLSDQYGSGFAEGEKEIHRGLIDNDRSGFANISDVIGIDYRELLGMWSATLYLDDRPGLDLPPELSISSWDLYDILVDGVQESWELTPREQPFAPISNQVGIARGSTAFFRLSGQGRDASSVRVRDPAGSRLREFMQMWIVRIQ